MGVAATVEVAALNGENNAKARFISCSKQLVACGHRSARPRIRGTLTTMCRSVFPRQEDVDLEVGV